MKATFHTWKNRETVKIISGDAELIVGISAGPRILSLHFAGGENLLFQDTTNFKVGDWCLYGGHRFTIAPENGKVIFQTMIFVKSKSMIQS